MILAVECQSLLKVDNFRIAHDIDLNLVRTISYIAYYTGNESDAIRCCNSENTQPLQPDQINPSCIPIPLPANDSFYADKGIHCQNYIRMQPTLESNCKVEYAHVTKKKIIYFEFTKLQICLLTSENFVDLL